MHGEIASAGWEELFDPFDEALIASPHAHYDRLRATEPIHWSPPLRSWVLTRMDDVRAVLNDDNFAAIEISKNVGDLARRTGRNYGPLIRVLDSILFFMDGDRHRNDRRTITKIINRKPLSQVQAVIEHYATSLAAKLSSRSEYDIVTEFADPLPQYIMAHILGVPSSDIPVLADLLAQLTLVFDPFTVEICDQANDKVGAAMELLKSRIAKAAECDEQSGLSIIYASTSGPQEERLDDAAATTLFTYRVGAETTTGMIGLIIRLLLQKPVLLQQVREEPSLVTRIVSETLRLESNVQRVVRVARETRTIKGHTIESGQRVLLLLGAANRDPDEFVEPNSVSLKVREGPDVTFGAGSHFCLGASLARLEGEIALRKFLQLPLVEQAGAETWYLGRSIRRLTRLPVRVKGGFGATASASGIDD